MRIELDELAHLKAVFQTLLPGYHISNEDFGLYTELQNFESLYDALFRALGYELRADPRGFYYLLPEEGPMTMNVTTQKMALLTFLMVEYFADEGKDPYEAIVKSTHDAPTLACALYERFGEMLKEGGIDSADAVEKCFATSFRRLGFATINGDVMHFRPPIVRLLDICVELGREKRHDEALAEPQAEPAV